MSLLFVFLFCLYLYYRWMFGLIYISERVFHYMDIIWAYISLCRYYWRYILLYMRIGEDHFGMLIPRYILWYRYYWGYVLYYVNIIDDIFYHMDIIENCCIILILVEVILILSDEYLIICILVKIYFTNICRFNCVPLLSVRVNDVCIFFLLYSRLLCCIALCWSKWFVFMISVYFITFFFCCDTLISVRVNVFYVWQFFSFFCCFCCALFVFLEIISRIVWGIYFIFFCMFYFVICVLLAKIMAKSLKYSPVVRHPLDDITKQMG